MQMARFFPFLPYFIWAAIPIQFSIPESKIIQDISLKTRGFAYLIPGQLDTYIYNDELSYRRGYQEAYFAVTCKKGGWDCLRHYEILANGCIPYFVDLDQCDMQTMPFLPKELIWQAMHLPGVSYLHIDEEQFDIEAYDRILHELLAYTRNHLTTRKMAEYILDMAHYPGEGKILYLSCDLSPDYMRCLNLIGLKELLGDQVVDVPKIEHIYQSCPSVEHLYGKGFTYTQIVEDVPVNREHIEQRIVNREFVLIIYGSVHRGLLYHDLVCQMYDPAQIIYVCGNDCHQCEYLNFIHSSPFFIRELGNN